MNYFRAIVKSNEISKRAYEISGFVLNCLSSNYNAYFIRMKYLESLPAEEKQEGYEKELQYISNAIKQNPKTFQAWSHRKYLVQVLNKSDGEINFLEEIVFEDDNKNYHGWSYRIWLCQHFNLYMSEWEKLPKYFIEDIRNNSAWNYRYFLFQDQLKKLEDPSSAKEKLSKELTFIFESIHQVPQNESVWNYLLGWFQTHEFSVLKSKEETLPQKLLFKLTDFPQITTMAEQLLQVESNNRYLLHLCIQLKIASPSQTSLQEAGNVIIFEYLKQESDNLLIFLKKLCELLAFQADKIRKNYWLWFLQNLKVDFAEFFLPV